MLSFEDTAIAFKQHVKNFHTVKALLQDKLSIPAEVLGEPVSLRGYIDMRRAWDFDFEYPRFYASSGSNATYPMPKKRLYILRHLSLESSLTEICLKKKVKIRELILRRYWKFSYCMSWCMWRWL